MENGSVKIEEETTFQKNRGPESGNGSRPTEMSRSSTDEGQPLGDGGGELVERGVGKRGHVRDKRVAMSFTDEDKPRWKVEGR